MTSFRPDITETFYRSIDEASSRHHEYVTVEHLLLALIDDAKALAVFSSCGVDCEKLRTNLSSYLDNELESIVVGEQKVVIHAAAFQRVIQRAMLYVQAAGGNEVTGADVLIAVFSERESFSVYFLQEQNMTRYDAVYYAAQLPKPNLRPSTSMLEAN